MAQYCAFMRRNSLHRIGAALVDARRRLGWTQADVARRAGVSRRWVGDVEAGRRPGAELSRLLDVMDVLGLEMTISSEGAAATAPAHRSSTPTQPGATAAVDEAAEMRLRELGVL